ncbi:MAG: penicillin-binding protein 2 [Gaiellales bacterium]|nr:penicillin-binding protein 2 [Gaiellales bacterium]
MYLEPAKKLRAPSDDPSTGLRLGMILLGVLLMFSVLVFRLWFLQVLSGDQYVSLADDNRTRTVELEAPRGLIYDCNGKVLVGNRAGLSVGVLPMELRNEANVIPRLASLLGMPAEDLAKKIGEAKRDPYRVTVLAEDVPETPTVAYLEEHSLEFPGIRVEKSYLRNYGRPAFAAHILGYVGEISEEGMNQERFRSLPAGSIVGKEGLEYTYDSYLRGINGSRTVEVDYQGRAKRLLDTVRPTAGHNVVLTIDSTIQEVAERAIKEEGIDRAHAAGFKEAAGGAVIALDPRSGEILALTSYPDYDPTIFVNGLSAKENTALSAEDAHQPLTNRATMGLYPPASTFKAFITTAALQLGLVDRDTVFNCPGTFSFSGQVLRCWNPDGHGDVNLVEAIMESCDIYFYNLGLLFNEQTTGMQIQATARRFGFGQATGIDLPGESLGLVPDDVWKAARGATEEDKLWMPGDDVNLSIGQGNLLVTPLQLAVAYSAIANGGKVMTPRLAKSVTDGEGTVIHEFTSEVVRDLELDDPTYDPLYEGLRLVTGETLGTAYSAFAGFPIQVAGKTGTAEKLPEADYAWFVGYAPADAPEIVVVALVEQGGHGSSVAAPVVRRVMEVYFQTESTGVGAIEATD